MFVAAELSSLTSCADRPAHFVFRRHRHRAIGFHSKLDNWGANRQNIDANHRTETPAARLVSQRAVHHALPLMNRFTALRSAKILAAIATPMLIMSVFLTLALEATTDYLLILIVLLIFVSILPELCVDPRAEDEEARRRPDKDLFIRPLCVFFLVQWVLDQPEMHSFIAVVQGRLWDWRPVTVVGVFCAHLLHRGLRKALAFKVTDLYPQMKRVEEPAVP